GGADRGGAGLEGLGVDAEALAPAVRVLLDLIGGVEERVERGLPRFDSFDPRGKILNGDIGGEGTAEGLRDGVLRGAELGDGHGVLLRAICCSQGIPRGRPASGGRWPSWAPASSTVGCRHRARGRRGWRLAAGRPWWPRPAAGPAGRWTGWCSG